MLRLTGGEIRRIHDSASGLFDSRIRSYAASEVDSRHKNQLLDDGYAELLGGFLHGRSSVSIVIDDYGIGGALRAFLGTLESKGIRVITASGADERYAACKMASLVARRARAEEIENINSASFLNSRDLNRRILPGSGAPSNPETARYLIGYRRQHPSSEFPPFVRRGWRNVAEIDAKFPRRR